MSELPLSKYYDPADLDQLGEELVIVDKHFHKASPQSEHRRWEYAMAVRAADQWAQADYDHYGHAQRTQGSVVYDVGGAGSPFYHMAGADYVRVVDPHEPGGQTLAQVIRYARLGSMVFCLSVLEHVDDLDQFCYHLGCLVAPGGLLFLTVDCCGCNRCEDPHHFNNHRKRIFHRDALESLFGTFVVDHHMSPLDGTTGDIYDRKKYAPRLYDGATDPGYSFASLALVKRR